MYQSINKPLRDGCSETRPHPFPSLVANLSHALSSLRVHAAAGADTCTPRGGRVLWRGVRDFDLSEEFKERGVRASGRTRRRQSNGPPPTHTVLTSARASQGTELAPMSTTASQTVATEYATRNNAQHSLLLRLNASTFMDSGCDISFLSGERRRAPCHSYCLSCHTDAAPSVLCPPPRCAAFPEEQEFLFPPGTYLSVKEGSAVVRETVPLVRQSSRGAVHGQTANVMIVDVVPAFPAL